MQWGVGGKLKGGYRYICLNCNPGPKTTDGFVDLCELCMAILRLTEVNEENKMRKEKLLDRLSSHLWLRICFGDSYYDY